MRKVKTPPAAGSIAPERSAGEYRGLSERILQLANRGGPRLEFLRETVAELVAFSGCDGVEVRLDHANRHIICAAWGGGEAVVHRLPAGDDAFLPASEEGTGGLSDVIRICLAALKLRAEAFSCTRDGSLWTNAYPCVAAAASRRGRRTREDVPGYGECRSIAVIPASLGNRVLGALVLGCRRAGRFTAESVEAYEDVARAFAASVVNQESQAALRERVKELTCLYGIAQAAQRPNVPLDEMLQGIVDLLPGAWQYPDQAFARIVLDGRSFKTRGFREGGLRQIADLIVNGLRRGWVKVGYADAPPGVEEDPFLPEERYLIDTVAQQVSLIIERREAEGRQRELEEQLRHAERLATLGQLTAGIAHELNEPLGSILGFAQLARKCAGLPASADADLAKIESSTLHAREIIRKLMLFARQTPPQKARVLLNAVVEEALGLLQSRCARAGVEVVRRFDRRSPAVIADRSQLNQVLVNLIVNAIQAMPRGGRLTLETFLERAHAGFAVSDTGVGIPEDVLPKILLPFFTTKDVHEGTGLGLAVVHGIVTAHGGTLHVASKAGQGARFEVRLPLPDFETEVEG